VRAREGGIMDREMAARALDTGGSCNNSEPLAGDLFVTAGGWFGPPMGRDAAVASGSGGKPSES
jgi:hypothetical protein